MFFIFYNTYRPGKILESVVLNMISQYVHFFCNLVNDGHHPFFVRVQLKICLLFRMDAAGGMILSSVMLP
jgi:hypothetical protein